ncbi:hypothetical protein IU510_03325 [Nocardia cyriacigeorgica]|uniref:hypothetical protein n=1 Tax=Nocardia cyriacigeorgica TaxID=135487 RepID=UPI001893FF8E|nr:hypothetical protein [Nocardia cyriacigeorgica]MBF6097108.1 hypothetical protein [Nocardia cyriacigeorgica]MBF6158582.1 hypothetical protein [Nocardia cyriacigeorgica]MBF6197730.1 hypothetical protein [Nocardia cyriacigeorgica]MBF6517723.1 hypothetical protein [Nocardia cyriacigeorgica]
MKVRFIGGESGGDGSPRLYATVTEPPRYAVQGWLTDDPGTVEIPHRLLQFTEPGTCLSGLRDTGHGSFLLSGEPVTDPEALEIMKIPAHESAVLVPIGQEVRPDAPAPRR